MTASWLQTDLGGVAPIKAGPSLLPPGTNTYTITNAVIEDGRQGRELLLTVSSPNGAGSHSIPLQPWKDDEASVKLWLGIIKAWFEGLGLPNDGQLAQLLHNLSANLPGIIGAVVELDVKHNPGKPMVDKATNQPILDEHGNQRRHVNQKVYMGRLVQAANGQSVQLGQASPPPFPHPTAAEIRQSVANDDDIPF